MSGLSHFDQNGASRMVDVSDKAVSSRGARASGRIRMADTTLELIRDRNVVKGDVLEVSRLAGIMASKQTANLIPLCHPLPLDAVEVNFTFVDEQTIEVQASVQVTAKTGVEMEALAAASVALLTIYDMCKSVDRGMTIERVQLEEKSGGRSGHYQRTASPERDRSA
ncbi:MAG: cyclic pyranopterin monophosphate synthase MoaC [Pirellulales bacterium]